MLVCLHHTIDRDPSLAELADLPLGWWAERNTPDEPWYRYERQAGEETDDPVD